MDIQNCIFCGSECKVWEVDGHPSKYHVVCLHCLAMGPAKDTKEDAVKAWDWIARIHFAAYNALETLQKIL